MLRLYLATPETRLLILVLTHNSSISAAMMRILPLLLLVFCIKHLQLYIYNFAYEDKVVFNFNKTQKKNTHTYNGKIESGCQIPRVKYKLLYKGAD